MGIFDFLKAKGKRASEPDRERARVPENITVYDERGRELQIERAVWEKDILLPNLEKARNDPDKLYQHIVQALRDGFAESVVEAAERLVAIDGSSERALLVDAIVLMETGNLDGAEKQIRTCFEKHGTTGIALTNLAKVQERRGLHDESRATLRQALDADPNQDNGLLWWAAIARDRAGDAGYLAALEEIAGLPRAWRPQLWIARERLRQGDRQAALRLYEQVLSAAVHEPGVLMMVSGDLGNAGALEDLVRLVTPHYDADRDGFEAGLNLIEALKQLGRTDEARDLVRKLQQLGLAPLADRLARLEQEIVDKSLPQVDVAPPQIAALRFEGPLWTRGLYEPLWLIPDRAEDAPELTFVVLANETTSASSPQVQKTDDAGRLTRALPLYLTEAFHIAYNAKVACMVLAAQGHGPVVFGEAIKLADIASLIPQRGGPQIVVLGSIVPGGVRVEAWDLKQAEVIASTHAQGGPQDMGALGFHVQRELAASLLAKGVLSRAAPPSYYRAPGDDLRYGYLLALEQLLHQLLVANEVAKPESLWNERGFFETYFELADAWPDTPANAQLIAVCGVTTGALYKSALVGPYRKLVLRWLDGASRGSVLDRIAPAVLKRLGEKDRLAKWLERAPPVADASYAAWLTRVREAE